MAARLSKSVSVRFSELLDAFEFVNAGMPLENQAYICTDTGTIYLVSSIVDMEEVPDDIETSDQYLNVPHKNDLELGRSLVFSFVNDELPNEWNTVADIFRRKGAYGRFKQMLRSHGILDKWWAFEASAVEKALREWCQENGIQLSDT